MTYRFAQKKWSITGHTDSWFYSYSASHLRMHSLELHHVPTAPCCVSLTALCVPPDSSPQSPSRLVLVPPQGLDAAFYPPQVFFPSPFLCLAAFPMWWFFQYDFSLSKYIITFSAEKKRLLYSLIFDTWELPHIEHIFGQTTKHWKLVIVLFLNEKGRNDVKLIYCTSRTFWSPASLLSEYKVVNKLLIIILLYLYYYNVIATTVD